MLITQDAIFVPGDMLCRLCKQYDHVLMLLKNQSQGRIQDFFQEGVHSSRGGHLGIFWVGMCRLGLQIGIPF